MPERPKFGDAQPYIPYPTTEFIPNANNSMLLIPLFEILFLTHRHALCCRYAPARAGGAKPQNDHGLASTPFQ
jgi:hypothetical protein